MKKYTIFIMTLMILVSVFSAAAQEIITIDYDSPVTGTITEDQLTRSFSFTGSAGDMVLITALEEDPTDELPLLVRLFGSGGALLGESYNIDVGARLGPLDLPADGAYTIAVTRELFSDSTGGFSLLAQTVDAESIAFGDQVEGYLPHPGSAALYTLEVETDTLFAFLTDGFTMGFNLFNGNELLINYGFYDGPANLINRIPAGTYQIILQTLAEEGTDYRLYLPELEPDELAVGSPVSGTESERYPAVFTTELAAGKMYQFNSEIAADGARSMGLFTFFEADAAAYAVTFDYGSGRDGNPRIDPFIPETSGTYYIVLFYDDYDEATDIEVDYTMEVTPSTLKLLAPGTTLVGEVTPETGDSVFAYQGTAGERVRITLEITGGEGAPGVNMFSPDDEAFTFMGRSAFKTSVELELPLDGLYRFVVFNVSYDDLSSFEFRLLLERLEK